MPGLSTIPGLQAARQAADALLVRFARPVPPRFPVIDAHTHLNSIFAGLWRNRPVRDLLAAMDRAGVTSLVDLDGGSGDALTTEIARLRHGAPARFAVFAGIHPDEFAEDDRFGETEAARLEDSVRRGARGLKVWKTLGLRAVDPAGRLVPVDDERLDPLWATAARLDVPVLIHVADPPPFFQPLDGSNERAAELHRHPEWHYAPVRARPDEPGYPSHDELIDQFGRLVRRHPGTTFIGAHLVSLAGDLPRLAEMLERSPNLSVDIAARVNELGRRPAAARDFLVRFQDRVLFGTDGGPDPRWYSVYFRFFQTATRSMNYSIHSRPIQGDWTVDALELPDAVLQKLYAGNARRLIRFDA